jgi:hypothetical protein
MYLGVVKKRREAGESELQQRAESIDKARGVAATAAAKEVRKM